MLRAFREHPRRSRQDILCIQFWHHCQLAVEEQGGIKTGPVLRHLAYILLDKDAAVSYPLR